MQNISAVAVMFEVVGARGEHGVLLCTDSPEMTFDQAERYAPEILEAVRLIGREYEGSQL